MNEWINEWMNAMNELTHKGMKEGLMEIENQGINWEIIRNEWMNEWINKGMQWTNECIKEWRTEWMEKWIKDDEGRIEELKQINERRNFHI